MIHDINKLYACINSGLVVSPYKRPPMAYVKFCYDGPEGIKTMALYISCL